MTTTRPCTMDDPCAFWPECRRFSPTEPGPDDCQECGAPLTEAMPGLPRQCGAECWKNDAPEVQ
jgi:hypothetical protein